MNTIKSHSLPLQRAKNSNINKIIARDERGLYSISFKNKWFIQDVRIFKLYGFPWWIFQYVSQSPSLVSMIRFSHTFYGKKECQEYSWGGQIGNMVGTVSEFLISVLFVGSQYQISSRKDLLSRIKQLSHMKMRMYLWPIEVMIILQRLLGTHADPWETWAHSCFITTLQGRQSLKFGDLCWPHAFQARHSCSSRGKSAFWQTGKWNRRDRYWTVQVRREAPQTRHLPLKYQIRKREWKPVNHMLLLAPVIISNDKSSLHLPWQLAPSNSNT